MDIKKLIKDNLLSIICIVSMIALCFPFASITAEIDVMGYGGESSQSVNGFAALKANFLSFLLLVGPILLIAMNYVKQLASYKKILAITVPVICFIVLIITFIQAKSVALTAMGYSGSDMFDLEIRTMPGFGFILMLLSYIGAEIVGAMTYHNFKFDKSSLEQLKTEGASIVGKAQEKISQTTQAVSSNIEAAKANREQSVEHSNTSENHVVAQSRVKKSTNIGKTEEILELIEKLSKMKDEGVLTEEEFAEKKRQLLEEI